MDGQLAGCIALIRVNLRQPAGGLVKRTTYAFLMRPPVTPHGSFIWLRVTCGGRPLQGTRSRRVISQGHMVNMHITEAADRDAARNEAAPASAFTPAAFFRDAGTVIAVCLALGVLMQLLLQ